MCKVLTALREVPIIGAKNAQKGTQLKLSLQIEGNQTIFFKPAWYKRNQVIEGSVYSGKDRHNSEIVAFYLGAVLNMRWTPIVIGRKINLKEILPLADEELKNTIVLRRMIRFN